MLMPVARSGADSSPRWATLFGQPYTSRACSLLPAEPLTVGTGAHRPTLPRVPAIEARTRGRAAIQPAAMTTRETKKIENPVQLAA